MSIFPIIVSGHHELVPEGQQWISNGQMFADIDSNHPTLQLWWNRAAFKKPRENQAITSSLCQHAPQIPQDSTWTRSGQNSIVKRRYVGLRNTKSLWPISAKIKIDVIKLLFNVYVKLGFCILELLANCFKLSKKAFAIKFVVEELH